METSEIRGTSVLILGYGREGQSVHRWLTAQYPGLRIAIADQKEITPVTGTPEVYASREYLAHVQEYTTVIRSPGVPPYLPELDEYQEEDGYITSATNIFFSLCKGTTIGITGTKGKSTTSSLIAAILKSAHDDVRLVGNIGHPMLDKLAGSSERTIFVVELSSHQLEDIRYSPHVAVMLGIVPEHLDYYPDFATYVRAKANIIKFQTEEDVIVFNPENKEVATLVTEGQAKKITYGQSDTGSETVYLKDNNIIIRDRDMHHVVLPVTEIPLSGNLENVLAAIAVGHYMSVPVAGIAAAVKAFQALPHRLEFVGEFAGVKFYNDSLATIPEATIHALDALGPKVTTLIAGGFDRGLNFEKLGRHLAHTAVKTFICFPDTGGKIWQAVPDEAKLRMDKYDVTSMEEAVKLVYKHTKPGEICLLSPASASYNLFRDYADRGEQFKEWVRKLSK